MQLNNKNVNLRWAIIAINLVSLLAQIVQIGTITPTLSIFLDRIGSGKFQIGLVVAASWIAILLIYQIVPYAIHRLGAVNSIIISSIASLVAIAGMLFNNSVPMLFFLNFLLGCGLIIRWIVCDTWLLLLTDEKNRGKVIGVHETLMGLGIAIGPVIMTMTDNKTLFIFYTCLALLAASMIITIFLKKYDRYPAVPTEQFDKKISPLIFVSLFAALATGAIETSMISFLPLMYIGLGIVVSVATMLLASFGFGGAFLQMFIGWIADKTNVKFTLALICIIAIISIILLPYFGDNITAYIILFLCGGCVGGLNTLAVLDAGNKVQENQISTAMILIAVAYTTGSIIGPISVGYIIQYQHYGLLWFSLFFITTCLLLIIFSSWEKRKVSYDL